MGNDNETKSHIFFFPVVVLVATWSVLLSVQTLLTLLQADTVSKLTSLLEILGQMTENHVNWLTTVSCGGAVCKESFLGLKYIVPLPIHSSVKVQYCRKPPTCHGGAANTVIQPQMLQHNYTSNYYKTRQWVLSCTCTARHASLFSAIIIPRVSWAHYSSCRLEVVKEQRRGSGCAQVLATRQSRHWAAPSMQTQTCTCVPGIK